MFFENVEILSTTVKIVLIVQQTFQLICMHQIDTIILKSDNYRKPHFQTAGQFHEKQRSEQSLTHCNNNKLFSCITMPLIPFIHIHLLNDDKTHQIQYENNRNVSTVAYMTYKQ